MLLTILILFGLEMEYIHSTNCGNDFFTVAPVENSVPKSADFLFTFTNNKNKNGQDRHLPVFVRAHVVSKFQCKRLCGIHLRTHRKCRNVPPEWMGMELLEEIKEAAKKSKKLYVKEVLLWFIYFLCLCLCQYQNHVPFQRLGVHPSDNMDVHEAAPSNFENVVKTRKTRGSVLSIALLLFANTAREKPSISKDAAVSVVHSKKAVANTQQPVCTSKYKSLDCDTD
uniref:Uncharacterized protein n=1 Tax=Glossina pallidipes TaxID=7398 RepID=A0A1B0ABC9_GLOPL